VILVAGQPAVAGSDGLADFALAVTAPNQPGLWRISQFDSQVEGAFTTGACIETEVGKFNEGAIPAQQNGEARKPAVEVHAGQPINVCKRPHGAKFLPTQCLRRRDVFGVALQVSIGE